MWDIISLHACQGIPVNQRFVRQKIHSTPISSRPGLGPIPHTMTFSSNRRTHSTVQRPKASRRVQFFNTIDRSGIQLVLCRLSLQPYTHQLNRTCPVSQYPRTKAYKQQWYSQLQQPRPPNKTVLPTMSNLDVHVSHSGRGKSVSCTQKSQTVYSHRLLPQQAASQFPYKIPVVHLPQGSFSHSQ
jgi:hypothetical protein